MIKGVYFDGVTSDKKEVFLYVTETGRIGFDGVNKEPLSFEMIKVSPRIGNSARYIELQDGAQFETDDNDAIDDVVKSLSPEKFNGFIYRLESVKRFVLLMVFMVVFFAWGFIQYGVPYFSREIATMLPEDASEYLGQGILETLDESWFEDSQLPEVRKKELTAVFNDLLVKAGEENIVLEFRNSEKIGANAFALPNRIIVFTDDLINLSNSNDEIISIMLHEIGHLDNLHSLRATIQRFSLAMFVMVITGDVSTSSSIITALPVVLLEAGYSREIEAEADTYALEKMLMLHINPVSFATIMEKLEASHSSKYIQCRKNAENSLEECLDVVIQVKNESGKGDEVIMSYLSTHPLSKDRMKRFNDAAF